MKIFIRKGFRFLSALIASLFILEILVFLFYPQEASNHLFIAKFGMPNALRANINIEQENYYGSKYQIIINDKSIRNTTSIQYEKPDKNFRILILGDSITFGSSVSNNETFSFYLENILNRSNTGKMFEVLNAGTPAWGPLEYYFFLKNEGYKYNPDLVILALEKSDTTQLNMEQVSFKKSYIEEGEKGYRVHLEDPKIIPFEIGFWEIAWSKLVETPLYEFLIQKSHLFNFLRLRLTQIFVLDQQNNNKELEFLERDESPIEWVLLDSKKEKKIAGAFGFKHIGTKILIEKTHRYSQEKGFKFLTFQIPTHFDVLDSSSSSKYLEKLICDTIIFSPLKRIKEFQNKYMIPLFFPGDIHFLPTGHKLVAYLLFNFLASNNEINASFSNKLTPYTFHQIREEIVSSDLILANKVKLDPFWQFTEGMIFKNKHKFEQAKIKFENYLKILPNSYRAYVQLGLIFLLETDYGKATNYFSEAREMNIVDVEEKKNIQYLYNYSSKFEKAWPYIQKGELDKALTYLEEISEMEGHFKGEADNILALYYLKKGDMEKAIYYKNKNKTNKNFKNTLKQKLNINP